MKWTVLGNVVIAMLPRLISLFEKKSTAATGAEKRATIKEVILATVDGLEGATGRELLNDAEVAKAYDAMNDAIVAFQNILARKQVTIAATPEG